MQSFKYVIDEIPPSNNRFMGRSAKGFHFAYQEEKKKWEWLVRAAVGRNKPDKPLRKATVEITYYFKTRHRRDPDNYSGKFLLDGLVRAGAIEDDSFSNIDLILKGKVDRESPRTEIEVIKNDKENTKQEDL